MALIHLRRHIRVIWEGRPFSELEGFSVQIGSGIRVAGGDPVHSFSNTFIYSDVQPDVIIGYEKIGIPEFKSGRIWIGAGPIPVEGKDGNTYELRMSKRSRILAESQEAVVLVKWRLSGVS